MYIDSTVDLNPNIQVLLFADSPTCILKGLIMIFLPELLSSASQLMVRNLFYLIKMSVVYINCNFTFDFP